MPGELLPGWIDLKGIYEAIWPDPQHLNWEET